MKIFCGREFHYGFVIVACCCLMMGINIGIVFSCAGIFYKPVSTSIGTTVGSFGLYMSFLYVASTLMLPVAGRMIERYSARWLLSASSGVMGLTLLAMSLFTEVWEFWLAGVVLGLTVAFLLYLSFPTLVNRWFCSRVGVMIGICAAASGIGGVVLNPVGGAMIINYGWRWAYALFGLLVLVVETPVLMALLRDYPADKGLRPYGEGCEPHSDNLAVNKSAGAGIAYSRAVKMPVFYAVVVFSFLMMACSTLNLFVPNFVISFDYTIEQASFAASAVMIGVTVGKIALGHINDRDCRAGVAVTTLAGMAGLGLLISGHAGLWLILAGAFLFGWAYAGVMVQTAMLTRGIFGSRDYARIYSIVSIALAAGGAIASGGWGFIVDRTSYVFIFTIGVVMLAVCAVIGLLAMRRRG